jgi:UDP-N-acetylmuramate--alanine ligase
MKPELGKPLPESIGAIHFIGVAGSGMSGIARVFAERGHKVSGSDRSDSEVVESLRNAGVSVFVGHDPAHLGDADTVVVSSAVRDHNPEYVEAKARGLQVLHRSEALRYVMRGKRVLAVAGSHGKTTSTAMLATALHRAGSDVGFVNGGVVSEWGVSSRSGSDEFFVIEADESDRSFVFYDPAIVLITNIAPDHLDFYGSMDAIFDAFEALAMTAKDRVVLCADDEGTRTMATRLAGRAELLTYGVSDNADLRITQLSPAPVARVGLSYAGDTAEIELAVPGRLNGLNAAGIVGVLLAKGMNLQEAATAVSGFTGADRRFQFHGEIGGVRFFDDHAHHPTEVKAALETAQAVVGEGSVITMFQPHLFSRTQYMAQELADAFAGGSDHTIFFDIFGSREDPIEGVTTDLILDRLPQGTSYEFEPDWDRACELAVARAKPGDIVLTMSTGDLYQIVPRLLAAKIRHDEALDGGVDASP